MKINVAKRREVESGRSRSVSPFFGSVNGSDQIDLAVREMPDIIESPVVSVSTVIKALTLIIESQITSVLEDQLAGISGIDEITSVSRSLVCLVSHGDFRAVTIHNTGVIDIRDAVAQAQRVSPMKRMIRRCSRIMALVELGLHQSQLLRNGSHPVDRLHQAGVARSVSLISGVSSVDVSGSLYKVMYVRIKPELMAGAASRP